MLHTYKEIHAGLVAAKALIATPEQWIQGSLSNARSYLSTDANCFCSYGAVLRATSDQGVLQDKLMEELDSIAPNKTNNIIGFNDAQTTTHAALMEVWDRAIAKAAAMVVVENLQAARAKIEKPENWLQRNLSTTKQGYNVLPDHPEACRFCSVGAIRSVMPDHANAVTKYPEGVFLNTVVKSRSDEAFGIVSYNDHPARTHDEILSAFDEAIQLATEAANAI